MSDYLDCPYLHDVFDHYCNLFNGYQHCEPNGCEVLKLIQERDKAQARLKAVLDCSLCACHGCDNLGCAMIKLEMENECVQANEGKVYTGMGRPKDGLPVLSFPRDEA